MKRYATTIILACTLAIGEVHTFWEHSEKYIDVNGQPVLYQKIEGEWVVAKKVNWIVGDYKPMTVQWNVKMLGDEIIPILYFIAAWFFGLYPNRANRITISVFIYAQLVDIYFYFWNFKSYDYHIVYIFMLLGWYVLYRKSIKQQRLSK